jgi:hypothetical protein
MIDDEQAASALADIKFGPPKVLWCTALHLGDPTGRKKRTKKKLRSATVAIDRERDKVSETSTDVLTPLDVENEYRIPRSSQKKGRAKGSFAPYFRVGRRVYYRRCVLEAWIAEQEQPGREHGG